MMIMVIIIMMIKFMMKIMILLPMVMISSSYVTFRAIGKKRRMKFVIYHGETENNSL